MRLRTLVMLLLWPLLAACATQAAPPTDTGIAPPQLGRGSIAAPAAEVDYSCRSDSDCTIKNVGNCCGHYPACVNTDSPTFPDLVRERCEAEGMMAVCGFPEISGCQCIEGRCEADGRPGGGLRLPESR